MKILKISFLVAIFIALCTACAKKDFNDNDELVDNTSTGLIASGNITER